MSKTRRIDATGIAWYSRENYSRCKKMFTDGEVLPATYELWLEKANDLVRQLSLNGHRVIRAEIDPDTFPAWCKERGVSMDAKARSDFGSFKAAEILFAEKGEQK